MSPPRKPQPIHKRERKETGYMRPPRYGYLTWRLNEKQPCDAIGFHVQQTRREDDDEDQE